ncbi:Uncharacterised protein [Streptococcus pneumoniae]|nr:Uncharacterised protein [Streptococcus pneumoniae]CAG6183545.1 Uncharacterised protein [Streptococcus pneumoniae]
MEKLLQEKLLPVAANWVIIKRWFLFETVLL